ncbi:MAG: hypothetical protein HY735_17220 [Verrucomicrobia bacterium]|nr:hypothetical protein [Verrucomicrobiota bacterium]
MNPSSPPSTLERSPLMRCLRWFFSPRGLRRLAIVLAWAATLIALFYAEENWRGWRAWNKYRQECEARGVQLNYQTLWPKPVPDDQNFAATPAVKSWFENSGGADCEKRWMDKFSLASRRVPSAGAGGRLTGKRRFVDLVAWEEAFAAIQPGQTVPPREEFASNQLDRESRAKAAPGVLAGLKTHEPVFEELRAASRRSVSRYPLQYDVESPHVMSMPHTENLWAACRRLELRACAELAAGQSEAALEDVKLMLYLADSVRGEPIVISQWDRVSWFSRAVQPIWEGLTEHVWSQSQLQELATQLLRYDFLADGRYGLDAERAGALWTIDCIAKSDQLGQMLLFSDERSVSSMTLNQLTRWPILIVRLMPSGWLAWEKLNYCRNFEIYLRSGFEPSHKRVSPAQIQANAAEADRLHRENRRSHLRAALGHSLAAAMLLPPHCESLVRGFIFGQAIADQATLACALEQYRLAHGQFPEKLDALRPQFISQSVKDALTGEPYKYRRTEDDRFVLYSAGWNEKDDGGTVALQKDGNLDLKNGDWVWDYPKP